MDVEFPPSNPINRFGRSNEDLSHSAQMPQERVFSDSALMMAGSTAVDTSKILPIRFAEFHRRRLVPRKPVSGPEPLGVRQRHRKTEHGPYTQTVEPSKPISGEKEERPPKYSVADSVVTISSSNEDKSVDTLPDTFDSAEDVLALLENPGRFQLIQFILMCLMFFTLSFNDLVPVFYTVLPLVSCQNPQFGLQANQSSKGGFCQCAGGGVAYTYPESERMWSIVADMHLICDRASLITVSTTMYFLGNLVAGPSSGSLADKIGRRKALLISNVVYTLASFGCIFSRDIISFSILRFIVGMGRQGIHSVGFVLMLEWMTPWRRGPGCAIAVFAITLGALVLTFLAWLIQNWWYIQIILTAANIWYFGLIWFAPESLKWLLLHNRTEQAKAVVERVARFNKLLISQAVYERIDEIAFNLQLKKNNGKPYSVGDWFHKSAIRRFIVYSCWIWFASSIVYLCFSILLPPFTTDLYSNLAVGIALELFARIIATIISTYCGNRRPLLMYFIIGGALAFLTGVIPGANLEERRAKAIVMMFGRMVISMCSSVQFVYVQELFPTIVRNSAFGLCSVTYRIGGALGSYLVVLASFRTCLADGVSTGGLTFEVMGWISMLGAVTTYFLPETRGKKMPETLQGTKQRDDKTQELEEKFERDIEDVE